MQAFQEGKAAAKEGKDHFDNPYPDLSQEGHAWGNGWLVGHDPDIWGDLESHYTEPTSH